jgi:hypothetical protein
MVRTSAAQILKMSELICVMRMTRFYSCDQINRDDLRRREFSLRSRKRDGRRLTHNKLSIAFFSAEYDGSVCAMSESDHSARNIGRRHQCGTRDGNVVIFRSDTAHVNHDGSRKPSVCQSRGIAASRCGRECTPLELLSSTSRQHPLCVPKTLSGFIRQQNRLSWRDNRADLVCCGRAGLAIQVEEQA